MAWRICQVQRMHKSTSSPNIRKKSLTLNPFACGGGDIHDQGNVGVSPGLPERLWVVSLLDLVLKLAGEHCRNTWCFLDQKSFFFKWMLLFFLMLECNYFPHLFHILVYTIAYFLIRRRNWNHVHTTDSSKVASERCLLSRGKLEVVRWGKGYRAHE